MDVVDELIKLHEEHVSGLLRLCGQAGWPDYGEQELKLLVQQGRFFGYQNVSGDIISCIGLFLFGRLTSIGLVIVDKEYQRLGLGRRMVNACITQTDENTAIRLCATKEGLPLYEKAGFHTAGSVRKYSCHSFQPYTKKLDAELTSFREQDFHDLTAADLAAFGGDRSNLFAAAYFCFMRMYHRQKSGRTAHWLRTFCTDTGQFEIRPYHRSIIRCCSTDNYKAGGRQTRADANRYTE